MKRFFIACILLFTTWNLNAQTFFSATDKAEREALRKAEIERWQRGVQLQKPAQIDDEIDAIYYKLEFEIGIDPNTFAGKMTGKFIILSNNKNSIKLDFDSYLNISGVGGKATDYNLVGYDLVLDLNGTYNAGDTVEVFVEYAGIPRTFGTYAGLWFANHGSTSNNTRAPVIFTLSEPFGARSWWPCKDDPRDKPESMDIHITVPAVEYHGFQLYAVSNGTLMGITENGNNTRTYHWHEQYPIATYLVSLAISNYQLYSEWYVTAANDSMPVDYFVYPERIADTTYNYTSTVDMIRTYSERFIEYPFIEEKYGMANFGWGGAMEHQTVSSMGSMGFWVVAHELAHQWFGDHVTCADFGHIWLNEGWATYLEAIYAEELGGFGGYRSYMNDIAYYGGGTIYVEDPLNDNVFAGIVYDKGAWVNHMLRGVMGDSSFFSAVKAYLSDPQFAYKAATTEDFQAVMEQYYGADMSWFFQQWIYGEGYPQYEYTWNYEMVAGKYKTYLTIQQKQHLPNANDLFVMPIQLVIMTIPGPVRDSVTVFNDQRTQTFEFITDLKPASIQFDPLDYILSTKEYVANLDDDGNLPFSFNLEQNYPNPFNPVTTIDFQIPDTEHVSLEIFDSAGKKVAELLNEKKTFGTYSVQWNASGVSSGVYYYRLKTDSRVTTKKCLLVK